MTTSRVVVLAGIGSVALVSATTLSGCAAPAADVAAAVPDAVSADGTLLAVTDPTFPPAQLRATPEFQGVQRGELTGFEVELLEAVAGELGLDTEWLDVPFEEVLPTVVDGGAEVGSAAITVTDERLGEVSFVTFFRTGVQWVVREPNPSGVSPDDACGERVAVQAGTVSVADLKGRSAACEAAGGDPIEVVALERQDEVAAAVATGRAAAFVADAPTAAWAIGASADASNAIGTGATGRLVPVGGRYGDAPYGWAVTDDALADALLAGLQAVVRSGDYAEVLRRWGVEDGALPLEDIEVVRRSG